MFMNVPIEMKELHIEGDQQTDRYIVKYESEEVSLENFRVTDDCQWLAVSPSWQPHHHLNHHVNHIIMSITSSSNSWEA